MLSLCSWGLFQYLIFRKLFFHKSKYVIFEEMSIVSLKEAYSFCVKTERDYEDRIRRAVFTLADEKEVCFSSHRLSYKSECKGQYVWEVYNLIGQYVFFLLFVRSPVQMLLYRRPLLIWEFLLETIVVRSSKRYNAKI